MAQEHNKQIPSHEHHIVPVSTYLKVYLALIVLMVLTVLAAQFHFGALNNTIAMTIAVVKATLVILFFMGVRYQSRLTWLWAGVGFIWLLLLFSTIGDYFTRDWVRVTGWPQ